MTRRFAWAAALCIATAGAFLGAQGGQAKPASAGQQPSAPPVTYSADVTLVEVDAVVTDNEGRVVRDLRKEDFEVFENGKAQTVDRISFVEIPIEHAEASAAAARPRADVQTNMRKFEGRLYVLLLDDVQTSSPRAVRVKSAARRFVSENLEPGDLAAVVHVSGLGAANQDFTADTRLLLASIDRFQGRKVRSETLNLVDEHNRRLSLTDFSNPVPMKDPDEEARAEDARSAFNVITGVGRRLANVRGRRKALLWFGEGVGFDMFDLSRNQSSVVLESARAAVAAATRANLVIYGIDTRGLGGLGEETAQLSRVASDPSSSLNASGLQQELRRSQDHLRKVSNDTGGFAVLNTDEFSGAFDRVVMENSAYYLLGYYPANAERDSTYRRLDVKVKRPGTSVRARTGYLAARSGSETAGTTAGAPTALRDALSNPVPQSSMRMATHAAAFKGKGDKASVLVTVEYAAAAFEAPSAASGDRLQASVIAIDPLGKLEASDHTTIGLDVKPQTRQAMKVLGFRTHSRMELPPGRYQLRIAGVLANGLTGSVHHDIEVPNFNAPDPILSDLIITSIVAGLVPTAHPDERMRQVLPAPPSTSRDFRQDEAIALFTEIYQGGHVPANTVTFTTTIKGAGDKVAYNHSDTRTVDQLKQTTGGYSLQVPLRQLEPGEYSLRLEGSVAGATPTSREAAFRVWAVPAQTSDAPSAGAAPSTPQNADLPFVVVARGPRSGVGEARQTVVRSAEEWQALWGSLPLRSAAPQVAFANTMIAALFLGTRPTAGFEPQVVAVRRDGDTLVVQWREQAPPDNGNPPAVTTPFAIVGVPMQAGEVRFERVQ